MWNDYFYQIQNKYNMRVSTKEPLVIRLDGKDVTKDTSINFIYSYKDSFLEVLEKSAWYFSKKYHCYALFGTDEISFVFTNPMELIEDLDSSKVTHSNEIIAMFIQYFFDYFNSIYKDRKIFFHGKCFSISEGKVVSYIKYRSKSIKNVLTTYLLKKNNIKMGRSKIEERLKKCEELGEYETLKSIINGTLYYDGSKLDIEEFFNGNNVIIGTLDGSNNEEIEIEFIDF